MTPRARKRVHAVYHNRAPLAARARELMPYGPSDADIFSFLLCMCACVWEGDSFARQVSVAL